MVRLGSGWLLKKSQRTAQFISISDSPLLEGWNCHGRRKADRNPFSQNGLAFRPTLVWAHILHISSVTELLADPFSGMTSSRGRSPAVKAGAQPLHIYIATRSIS
jgi:hypothetical protein